MNYDLRLNNVLRDIVEFLNDIADFEAHGAILLANKSSNEVDRSWHHLTSFKKARSSWQKQLEKQNHPFWVCLKSCKSQPQKVSMRISQKSKREANPINRIWIPLVNNTKPIGAFFLDAKLDRRLSSHVQWLCENIIRLGMKTIIDGQTANLWEKMRFGILHRKFFFSMNPDVDELLNEYLDRCFRILQKKEVKGTVRVVEYHRHQSGNNNSHLKGRSQDEKLMSLIFRAPKSLPDNLYDTGPTLSKKNLDRWHKDSLKNTSINLKDPDADYFKNFSNAKFKSHFTWPSICEDKMVALFSLDSKSLNAFSENEMIAIAILVAHAAPLIANAVSREKMEEYQNWLENSA